LDVYVPNSAGPTLRAMFGLLEEVTQEDFQLRRDSRTPKKSTSPSTSKAAGKSKPPNAGKAAGKSTSLNAGKARGPKPRSSAVKTVEPRPTPKAAITKATGRGAARTRGSGEQQHEGGDSDLVRKGGRQQATDKRSRGTTGKGAGSSKEVTGEGRPSSDERTVSGERSQQTAGKRSCDAGSDVKDMTEEEINWILQDSEKAVSKCGGQRATAKTNHDAASKVVGLSKVEMSKAEMDWLHEPLGGTMPDEKASVQGSSRQGSEAASLSAQAQPSKRIRSEEEEEEETVPCDGTTAQEVTDGDGAPPRKKHCNNRELAGHNAYLPAGRRWPTN